MQYCRKVFVHTAALQSLSGKKVSSFYVSFVVNRPTQSCHVRIVTCIRNPIHHKKHTHVQKVKYLAPFRAVRAGQACGPWPDHFMARNPPFCSRMVQLMSVWPQTRSSCNLSDLRSKISYYEYSSHLFKVALLLALITGVSGYVPFVMPVFLRERGG